MENENKNLTQINIEILIPEKEINNLSINIRQIDIQKTGIRTSNLRNIILQKSLKQKFKEENNSIIKNEKKILKQINKEISTQMQETENSIENPKEKDIQQRKTEMEVSNLSEIILQKPPVEKKTLNDLISSNINMEKNKEQKEFIKKANEKSNKSLKMNFTFSELLRHKKLVLKNKIKELKKNTENLDSKIIELYLDMEVVFKIQKRIKKQILKTTNQLNNLSEEMLEYKIQNIENNFFISLKESFKKIFCYCNGKIK